MIRSRWNRFGRAVRAGLALTLFAFMASATTADEQADRRILTGLKLFPALVAADQALTEKRGGDGSLHVVLLYREDADTANYIARRLTAAKLIRDLPVRVSVLPYARLGELRNDPPAALFLAEWSPDDLLKVAEFGREHHRLVFSPYKGDVAAGAQTGIFITDRILPLVNKEALDAAGVRLRPFLLEVAKTNE